MKSSRLLALCALLLVGCAAHVQVPHAPRIEDLRREAAARPRDAVAAREVALAEFFATGGDPARVTAALERALALQPGSPRVLFAQALDADVHGQPSKALDLYLQALESASQSDEPYAPHLFEAATYAVAGLDGDVVGYADRVLARLLPRLLSANLAAAARAALADAVLPLLARRGDMVGVRKVAMAVGCITELQVAGPFGPRQLLGFDTLSSWVDAGKPLAPSHDLGPGRGVRDTRKVHARGCSMHLGAGSVAEAGVTFAQAQVNASKGGAYVVRVDTPNNAEVFVDGRSVVRIDRRRDLGARAVFAPVELTAGPHLVTVAIAARHPNPVLELSLTAAVATDTAASAPPALGAHDDGFAVYLRTAVMLVRGDILGARQTLVRATANNYASAMLLLQRAGAALSDPLVPDDVKHDEVRKYLALCAARDPGLWAPPTQLAALAAKSGRVNEGIAALQAVIARFPNVSRVGFALVELLRSKGLEDQAEREITRLRELVPDACRPMSSELDMLRARSKELPARAAAERVMQCDAQSNVRFAMALDRRDLAAARAELARLMSLDPDGASYSWLLARLALEKNLGDEPAQRVTLAELAARYPRSQLAVIEEIDRLAAAGQSAQALAQLQMALTIEPTSMASLHRLAAVLGGKHVLSDYRMDGKKAIDAYLASGVTYDGPQVLALDYLAVRVFDDGSSLELVHTVQRAQSDEAVDELAEVNVPDGAQVLSLRAWKPDGRKLEADDIAGKDSISLPSVASGDFIEFEYLQAKAPPDGFPRGYLGERFYFTSFEIPFHHSRMVMVLPKDMPYAVDPRGEAPKTEERVDGELRVLTFQVNQSKPLTAEPASVSPREYIPSVRVGVRATWAGMIDSLRDALADRDLYDPYFAALAREIVGDAATADYRLRAERLYAWVLQNVDNNSDVFSQSALMLRAKSGNRARVLHYLLGLAGVPSQLALARNFAGDTTPSEMADADTYDHLLVRVDTRPEPIWLFTVERWAPFGFLPPVLRGQGALLLQPGAPSAVLSQGLLGEDARRIELDLALRADGSARVDVVETMHGSEAVSWRSQLEQIPAAELERRFEQDYVSRLFPGAVLGALQITGREQDKPELTLSYSIDIASYGRRVTGGLALPVLLTTDLAASYARSATRTTTELLAAPVRNYVTARITLPGRARPAVVAPPTALSLSLRGVPAAARPSFAQQGVFRDGVLTVTRALTLPMLRVPPREYAAFAEFCRQVDEAEAREQLVLVP